MYKIHIVVYTLRLIEEESKIIYYIILYNTYTNTIKYPEKKIFDIDWIQLLLILFE